MIAPPRHCWPVAVKKAGVVFDLSALPWKYTSGDDPAGKLGTPAGTLALYMPDCMLTSPTNGTPIAGTPFTVCYRQDITSFLPGDIQVPSFVGAPPVMGLIEAAPLNFTNAIDMVLLQGQWIALTFPYNQNSYGSLTPAYLGLRLATPADGVDICVPVLIGLFQSAQG